MKNMYLNYLFFNLFITPYLLTLQMFADVAVFIEVFIEVFVEVFINPYLENEFLQQTYPIVFYNEMS